MPTGTNTTGLSGPWTSPRRVVVGQVGARGEKLPDWVRLGDAERCFCASKKSLGAVQQRKGTSHSSNISMYRNLSPTRTQTRNRKHFSRYLKST